MTWVNGKARTVTIRGVTYPSHGKAAKALGVSTTAVTKARAEGRLDNIGLNPGGAPRKPITIRGVKYPSGRIAARTLGVADCTVSRLRRAGRADNIGMGRW